MIGEKTFEKGGEMLAALMKSYKTKINEAYLAADEELKIGLSLTVKPAACTGSFALEAGINFIAEKIKDQFNATVDELQSNLFEEVTVECPNEKREVCISVCEKCKDRHTTLIAESDDPNDEDGHITYMSCPAWADADLRQFYVELMSERDAKQEEGRKAA